MTNATKTLALVFAGSVVLALATSWSWSGTSSAAFQSNLLAVDTSAVQAVRIERSDVPSVRLERGDDGWTVTPADTAATYPASTQAVSDLFQSLPNLEVGAVTTRQADKHPRYGVDSTGTRIAMLGAGGEPLGELIVGRTRTRRPQRSGRPQNPMQRMRRRRGTPVTYVRPPDRPDVYSVEQSFGTVTSRGVEDWRDKQIWAVDRAQIRRVDLRYPADSSFTLRRAAPSDTAAAAPDTWLSAGDTLQTSEVSSMLRLLSSPTADGFVEDATPDAFGDALYTIRLQTADGSRRVLRLRPGPDDQHYVAVADDFPYVVEFRKNPWNSSVLRGRSALLKPE
jgi:hypothetical protein